MDIDLGRYRDGWGKVQKFCWWLCCRISPPIFTTTDSFRLGVFMNPLYDSPSIKGIPNVQAKDLVLNV